MPIIGTQQSPIRINAGEAIEGVFNDDYFEVRYENKSLRVKVDGHNLAFDGTPFHVITFDEAEWELRKIHIHSPSEHLVDSSKPFDFECHLIHYAKHDKEMVGPKVVLGVFFHKKEAAKTPKSILELSLAIQKLGAKVVRVEAEGVGTEDAPVGGNGQEEIEINPRHFLPRGQLRWFRYNGSLTSDPYSEDVTWFVMAKEIPVDPQAVTPLEDHAKQPAREAFSLNRRLILRNFPVKS